MICDLKKTFPMCQNIEARDNLNFYLGTAQPNFHCQQFPQNILFLRVKILFPTDLKKIGCFDDPVTIVDYMRNSLSHFLLFRANQLFSECRKKIFEQTSMVFCLMQLVLLQKNHAHMICGVFVVCAKKNKNTWI